MEIVLENNFLRVTINSFGAELTSVIDKESGLEMLWNANPEVWNRHAPILFPWCGRLKDGQFTHKGVTYQGEGHGFARDLEHSIVETRGSVCVLALSANAVTMEKYPFVFRLTTTYRLEGKTIRHEFLVENEGDWDMPFALGYHPGFICPFDEKHTTEDYELCFESPQTPIIIDTGDGGLVSGKESIIFENCTAIPLTNELFANDSICMSKLTTKFISLTEKDTKRKITVSCEGFPFVLLWTMPGEVKFVCIEPWHGLPDLANASGEWSEKSNTIILAKGEVFSTSLSMEFAR